MGRVATSALRVALGPLRVAAAVVAVAASAPGCGGGGGSGADAPLAIDAAHVIDAASTIDAGACSPGGPYGGGEATLLASSVTAKLVDETGAPVAGQPAWICGLDLCSPPATTKADGTVSISFNNMEKKPAFKVGDSIAYSEIVIPLAAGATDLTSGGTAALTLGRLGNKPGATLTAGATATSGDVSIAIPAGATVGIDQLTYATADQQKLRTARIPLAGDAAVLATAGVSGFGLFYGVAPAETLICPRAKVTVALPHATTTPNDLGWAPGAAVEFWVMTTDVGQIYAPYGGWAKISDGVVSGDGTTVSTVDGQGFDFLQSFAIRKP